MRACVCVCVCVCVDEMIINSIQPPLRSGGDGSESGFRERVQRAGSVGSALGAFRDNQTSEERPAGRVRKHSDRKEGPGRPSDTRGRSGRGEGLTGRGREGPHRRAPRTWSHKTLERGSARPRDKGG